MGASTAIAAISVPESTAKRTRLVTFLGLLLGYMAYYLCRQNFSVAFAPLQKSTGMSTATFGAIASAGTLVYTAGKLLTGSWADALGGRKIFFLGLFGSAAATLAFGFSFAVPLFFVFWGLNRAFQSMGWAGLVNVMAQWYSPREYGTAMGAMSISYQFGGVVASVFAGALLSIGLGWQALFIVPALAMTAVGLLIRPMVKIAPQLEEPTGTGSSGGFREQDETLTYWGRFRQILSSRAFVAACALSFILTFIRECFTLWLPAYFSTMGSAASMAAYKSSIFPLLGCAGTLACGWISDRFLKARREPVLAVSLTGLGLSLAGLAKAAMLAEMLGLAPATLSPILVGAAGFFLFGPYSMVGGGAIALDFGGKKTSATAAGLLDASGYLAATAAGWGIAVIVTRGGAGEGWSHVFHVMSMLVGVCVLICVSGLTRTKKQRLAQP